MNIRDHRWFELFGTRPSRRDVLRAGGHAAALVMFGALPARGDERRPRFRDDPFTLGVASGDPLPGGVVLWTRLDPAAIRDAGRVGSAVPGGGKWRTTTGSGGWCGAAR